MGTIFEAQDFITSFEKYTPLFNGLLTQSKVYEFPELPQIHEEINHIYWMSQNKEYVGKEEKYLGAVVVSSC